MTLTEYSQIKQEIVIAVGSNERHSQILSILKDLFKAEINSLRRTENIETIGQLLNVLELRDIISEDNVGPLKEIVRKIPNSPELLRKISEYEISHVPREPLNYYDSQNQQNNVNREPIEILHSVPYGTMLSKRKRQRIQETLVEEIGTFWRDLARTLQIRECFIDEIDSKNPTISNKAAKVLELFERKADPQRWFFVLCEALEKCRRKDLSRSLQEIMSMNI